MADSTNADDDQLAEIANAVSALASSIAANPDKAKGLLKKTALSAGPGSSGDTSGGSRYAKSRYAKSRYAKSRWPGDREKSVKNFTPAVGTAYWEPSTG